MRFAWLETLLPRSVLSARTELWWLLFFLLFPLAYAGGVLLAMHDESPAMMAGYEDRDASIRIAKEFAASKGYPVTGWHQYVIVRTNDKLLALYRANQDPAIQNVANLVPAQEVEVLFRSPDQSHEFRTYLSLLGKVTGYQFGKSKKADHESVTFNGGFTTTTTSSKPDDDEGSMKNAIKPTDMEADYIARKELATNADLSALIQLGQGHVSANSSDAAEREVTWEVSPPLVEGLTLHISVSVRDAQVVAEHIEGSLNEEAPTGHKGLTVRKLPDSKRTLPAYLNSIWGSFLTFCAIYAVIRYAKRTLQQEVSHLRTLLVAAFFAISYSAFAYSLAVDQIATRVSGETFLKISLPTYISAVVFFCILGLIVGLAYGSGEGEVREAYPGKLTSLDALLAGRIFSRNVAASILFGFAAAAWFMIIHHAVGHFLQDDQFTQRADVLEDTFARLPWLTLIVGRQFHPLIIAATGLLLPTAFLVRRKQGKSRRFIWLIIFAALSVLNDAAKYPTWQSSLLAIVVLVAALLLPFFAFDLLAALVSLSVLAFVEEITRLSAVFPSWNGLSESLSAIALLTLAVATYLALRGKPVDEDEVRPLYAKNLHQRMSLQAEVQAAREAQLRLLPQTAPDLPGVQFAACCLPARGVGGDFYDFFRLDSTRVGIFVAQGGDQGLASALCIALAKGVLMHSSLQPNSPAQTIANLEASISELLEGGNAGRISFAYGVMDTVRNVMTYARLGDSPRVVVRREDNSTAAPWERLIQIAGRSSNTAVIHEGSVQANAGDFVIFFTRGVTSLRAKRFSRREYQWLDILMPHLERKEVPLQTLLNVALSKHHHRATDDLTAVVLRAVHSQALVQEVVA